MNVKAVIRKKRDGGEHSPEEIRMLVDEAVAGTVPDYQLTAWMMAVFHRGMTRQETADLTRAMLESGEQLDFSHLGASTADKHSTGGVGDKVSLLVAPLVAAAGVPVPMISGRSLGHTGGTLDKLESIPGMRTDLSPEAFQRQVEKIGVCISGQSERLAPADRILYALRDAASIVESIPLITASILSKKAAAGIRALALDVKIGSGAFMKDLTSGQELGRSLVETAAHLGIRARGHLTPMDRVLGRTAGNALEIIETAQALRGERISPDLRALTLALGASMLELAGAVNSSAAGAHLLGDLWDRGRGYERLLELVAAQGGDASCLDRSESLPRSDKIVDVASPFSGFFHGVSALPAGEWITESGGGRLRAGDPIDPRVGVEIVPDIGARIQEREVVLRLHLPDKADARDLAVRAGSWILVTETPFPIENPIIMSLEPPAR